MPPWAISSDLNAFLFFVMYKNFLSNKSELYDKLADVTNSNSRKLGRRRSLNYEDINYIKSHCYLHSSIFLDELQRQLLLRGHVKILLSTHFRTL
ncbi:hypothetical protein BDR04DRAFT_1092287 [Suillus decipiens]|nr:hypothetical protein BDR04DRAFT_1092287 [Suillus decipiens]